MQSERWDWGTSSGDWSPSQGTENNQRWTQNHSQKIWLDLRGTRSQRYRIERFKTEKNGLRWNWGPQVRDFNSKGRNSSPHQRQ